MAADTPRNGAHDAHRSVSPALKAEERKSQYRAYVNNLRRALAPHLKSGIGLVARVLPTKDGAGVVTLAFGKELPNLDLYGSINQNLRESLKHVRDRSVPYVADAYGDKLPYAGEITFNRFNALQVDLDERIAPEEWRHFENDAASLSENETAMLMAPHTVIIAKAMSEQRAWDEEAAKRDAKEILRK